MTQTTTPTVTLIQCSETCFRVKGAGPMQYEFTFNKRTKFEDLCRVLEAASLSWSDGGKLLAVLSATGTGATYAEVAAIVGINYVDQREG